MTFPKDYNDKKYSGRRHKAECKGTALDGTPCANTAVRGKSLCGHCLDRNAAEEMKSREAAQRERDKK